MVGQRSLTPYAEVRILAPQLKEKKENRPIPGILTSEGRFFTVVEILLIWIFAFSLAALLFRF